MKILYFLFSVIAASAPAYATNISLPAGSSITLGDTQVSCEAGSISPQLIDFVCDCYNTGRTDNPAPKLIHVQATDSTQAMIDGKAVCSTLNYGDPTFGFSPVDHCRPAYGRP
jgi:hypothetical protein